MIFLNGIYGEEFDEPFKSEASLISQKLRIIQ